VGVECVCHEDEFASRVGGACVTAGVEVLYVLIVPPGPEWGPRQVLADLHGKGALSPTLSSVSVAAIVSSRHTAPLQAPEFLATLRLAKTLVHWESVERLPRAIEGGAGVPPGHSLLAEHE